MQFASALMENQKRITDGLTKLTLISADNELNTAAVAEGLSVENPNNYP